MIHIIKTFFVTRRPAELFKGTGHVYQRPVFSLGISQHMHQITNLWTFWLNRSSKLQENNERKTNLGVIKGLRLHHIMTISNELGWKEPLVLTRRLLCFSILLFEWEITSQKLSLLQRELFLTMFYAINSSPLLVTRYIYYAKQSF